jgi:hypothetical protein
LDLLDFYHDAEEDDLVDDDFDDLVVVVLVDDDEVLVDEVQGINLMLNNKFSILKLYKKIWLNLFLLLFIITMSFYFL